LAQVHDLSLGMALLTIAPQEFNIATLAPPNEFVGPNVPFDFKIWQTLVNYHQWASWMEGVADANLVDLDSEPFPYLGRGSKFHLDGPLRVSTLEILHWAPCQKLVYAVVTSQRKFACSYTIEFKPKQHQTAFMFEGEVEVFGLRRLISPLVARRYKRIFKRQCQRLATVLRQIQ
jgi:hypothetical protein